MIDVMKVATGLSPQGRACLSETAADGYGEPSLPVQKEAHVKWQRKIFRNFGCGQPPSPHPTPPSANSLLSKLATGHFATFILKTGVKAFYTFC